MKRLICTALALALSLSTSSCGGEITEAEAHEIAEARLADYVRQNHLPAGTFGPLILTHGIDEWYFDASSKPRARHEVRIIVGRRGGSEVNAMTN